MIILKNIFKDKENNNLVHNFTGDDYYDSWLKGETDTGYFELD